MLSYKIYPLISVIFEGEIIHTTNLIFGIGLLTVLLCPFPTLLISVENTVECYLFTLLQAPQASKPKKKEPLLGSSPPPKTHAGRIIRTINTPAASLVLRISAISIHVGRSLAWRLCMSSYTESIGEIHYHSMVTQSATTVCVCVC